MGTPIHSEIVKLYKDEEIPSANLLYGIGQSGRRTWWFKLPEVRDFQDNLESKLKKQKALLETHNETYKNLEVKMVFVLKSEFLSRDVTNCIKAAEDAVHRILPLDDAYTMKFTAEKYRSPGDFEWVMIYVQESSTYIDTDNLYEEGLSEEENVRKLHDKLLSDMNRG